MVSIIVLGTYSRKTIKSAVNGKWGKARVEFFIKSSCDIPYISFTLLNSLLHYRLKEAALEHFGFR